MNITAISSNARSGDAKIFLALSLLSRFGDTVFLVGLPIHLYKLGGNSILSSTYVNLLITLTILTAHKLVLKVNAKNPLFVAGAGELVMFFIELVLLAVISITGESQTLILLFVIPLALTYNLYAPAKFFQLQDYFFVNKPFFFTTLQSILSSIGVILGILASGYIEHHFGLTGLLWVDALSFLAFGIPMLMYYYRKLEPVVTVHGIESPAAILSKGQIKFLICLLTASSLFLSWETASLLSVSAKSFGMQLTTLGFMRSVWGAIGLLIGLWLSAQTARIAISSWAFCLILLVPLTIGFSSLNPALTLPIFFMAIGVISSLAISIQRLVFRSLDESSAVFSKLNSMQWIYESALAIFITPIGYLSDHAFEIYLLPLHVAIIALFVIGGLGSLVTTKLLLGKQNE
ncbi:MAG: hypothetical protein HYV97_01410 [Bdellovibrio sp.]|nr:hypothetical protein [Bdellovibrio sp.]